MSATGNRRQRIACLLALAVVAGAAHADDVQRRPGHPHANPAAPVQRDPNRATAIPRVRPIRPPRRLKGQSLPVPDRWRILDSLGILQQRWWDPYNPNTYKADKPLHDDWFLDVSLTSDTVVEPRRFPVPVSPSATSGRGYNDTQGNGKQFFAAQTVIASVDYYKGDTVFRPPDYEYKLTLAGQYNHAQAKQTGVLYADPSDGRTRNDQHLGVQEAFVDVHLRNVSPRYDFDSVRFGIQPFNADFRGFLFQDEQFGARLFGTRDDNIFQYNLAWFRRIEKDTNSGLNDIGDGLRDDDVFAANLYWQDFPVKGFTTEASVIHNRNREGGEAAHYDDNGFIRRPASAGIERARNYDVTYFGLSGDGHFGRLNFTGSLYYAYGHQNRGTFLDYPTDIRAGFAAGEFSWDFDWTRVRLSALYASGDDDPYDDVSNGFDAIFENPLFAGADTSFWIRQPVPLVGGGGVSITTRNGVLNSLRSSKAEGQSNFDNPGTILLGLGADFDLTPQWRLSTNVNRLWFDETATLETARNQADIPRSIGTDVSVAAIYRPLFTQNIVLRASAATLLPGDGYKALYRDDNNPYSILLNLTLRY